MKRNFIKTPDRRVARIKIELVTVDYYYSSHVYYNMFMRYKNNGRKPTLLGK